MSNQDVLLSHTRALFAVSGVGKERLPVQQQDPDIKGKLWPSAAYERQIMGLRAAIGSRIYLVEIDKTDINLAVQVTDKSYLLLDVIEFPRPDPEQGIFPHMLLLGDGRGVNLGRIARITVNTPFNPPPGDVLYQEPFLTQNLLSGERRLSRASIASRSKALLGRLLGRADPPCLK